MQPVATRVGYGPTSILLHWAGAALVTALFVIGRLFDELPRGPDKAALTALHISLGSLAVVLIGGRIVWRLLARDGAPPVARPGMLDTVATLVKYALLLVMAILIITGPLSIWAGGQPINVFGYLSLPSPLPRNRDLHEGLEVVHGVVSKIGFVLVVLHVLGTLKHVVIDRDGTLRRMFVPWSRG